MMNRIRALLALSPLLLTVAPAHQAAAQCVGPPVDINGRWEAGDGVYFVRTVGRNVWWQGFSAGDGGRSWTHVFRGTKSGPIITGEWADVRGHMGSGTLTLSVSDQDRMVRIRSSDPYFGGVTWTRPWPKGVRKGCPDSIAVPAN